MKISKEDNDIIDKQKKVRQNIINQYIEYRKIRNLTQGDLADIKRPNISRFETGQHNPSLDLLVKMAESMDLEIRIDLIDKQEEQ